MRLAGWKVAALVLAAVPALLQADLDKAKNESNLEKRSALALTNASEQYKAARAAYEKGDNDRVAAAAEEILESVNLAWQSLKDTGKDPRRNPKYFKRAEIETRDLLRKLDGFEQEMSFTERPVLEKVKAEVQKVHDDLLLGLMEGNKKK
jgi:hypothetical protein